MNGGKAPVGFSGHETFPFRYGWLKKGVDALSQDPNIFTAEDATTRLGVGKNMVQSIRHWCLATGLIEELPVLGMSRKTHLRVSHLGEALMLEGGHDPFLEDPATLWLLHWKLVSTRGRSTTWYWVFNEWRGSEFTKKKVIASLVSLAPALGQTRSSPGTIKRDVDCFIRTYVPARATQKLVLEDTLDCPLVELGLIREMPDGESYRFEVSSRRSMPDSLLVYTLCEYWDSVRAGEQTLSFEQIAYAPGSPGRAFRMSDEDLRLRLESLEQITDGALAFDDTAGLKQVYRHRKIPLPQALARVYVEEQVPMGVGA